MQKFFQAFDRVLGKYFCLAAYVSVFIIVIASLFITSEVIARLFFNTSFQIVMQFSGYSLFIVTFLAAGWVLRQNAHIVVDFITVKIKENVRQYLDLFVFLLCIAACIFLFLESSDYVINAWERKLTTNYPLKVQKAYILFVMPLGWFTLLLEFIVQTWKKIAALKSGNG